MALAELSNAIDLTDRVAFDDVLAELAEDGRLAHVENQPARAAHFSQPHEPLSAAVSNALGSEELWTHQARAIDLIRERHSVVIATGTASGKSRCYQIPIAEAADRSGRTGTALLLFPTKALAQDQLRALAAYRFPGVVAGTYDGDSTPEQRAWVRSSANVILTNPEMLHAGLLPSHARWATFFGRLEHVVVDELHVLRGIFGTHVSHVLRRLRRLCQYYGSDPTFIFTSATIGAPEILASELCGKEVEPITADGSPQGERTIALLNPPLLDEAKGLRSSANTETASVAAELIRSGHRTIVFCRSRKGTELVTGDISSRLPADLTDSVRAYRSGYLAEERRTIEHELFDGTLRGVVATSALELGVDVGGLDACVLNTFPGTVASMWQQMGRAGRGQQRSAAILVAGDDQLDQWMMAHPQDLLTREPERAVINPTNPFVLGPHLACAAHEKPLCHADDEFWGDALDDGIRDLVLDDTIALKPSGTGEPVAVYTGSGRPSRGIGLRSGSADEYRIADSDGVLIGTVDAERAFSVVHPGAVYLHQGRPFRVTDLDTGNRVATVVEADGDEYTQARTRVDIAVLEADESATLGPTTVHVGAVEVTSQVTGYQRREVRSRRILSNEVLDLAPSTLRTRAFWYVVPPATIEAANIDHSAIPGSLHAAEHAAIGMLPLFAICDRWDVGGVSTAWHAGTGGPTIFVYDAHPGGSGIAELGFAERDRHFLATRDAVRACGCADGCPSCVQSPKCGNGNEPLDKAGAVALLDQILS